MRLANIATVLVHGRNELHLKFNSDADLRAAYEEITQRMEGADKTCGQHCGICHGDQELCDPHDCGDAALQWKFEQFIDFATGGKLSKSTWALETLKAAVTEYVNETVQACADDNGSTRWRRNEIPSSKP
jgi:hypothetical protein